MASLDGGFNANDVDPHVGFEPIPSGDYLMVLTASERKPTKAGDAELLELEVQIIDGPHKGRNLWDRLNLWNKSVKATEIARAQLSALCRAVGVMQPRDTVELHNIPFIGAVKVERREDNGEPTNRITAYKPRHGAAQPTGGAPTPNGVVPPPVATTATGKAPWQR